MIDNGYQRIGQNKETLLARGARENKNTGRKYYQYGPILIGDHGDFMFFFSGNETTIYTSQGISIW